MVGVHYTGKANDGASEQRSWYILRVNVSFRKERQAGRVLCASNYHSTTNEVASFADRDAEELITRQ